jgi:hypothetical protein
MRRIVKNHLRLPRCNLPSSLATQQRCAQFPQPLHSSASILAMKRRFSLERKSRFEAMAGPMMGVAKTISVNGTPYRAQRSGSAGGAISWCSVGSSALIARRR